MDCCNFYVVVLFSLTAILQSYILQLHNFSELINDVIFLFNCLVLMLNLYIHFLSLRCYYLKAVGYGHL